MPDQWPGSGEPTLFDDDQAAASVPLMTPEQADARRHELRGMSADERLQGILDVRQIREQLHQGFRAAYIPSRPCPRCGSTKAEIRQSGDHLPVSCLDCGGTFYNASKLEAGFKPRSVS
ncbi:MAG TPA: hypothetical protein VGP53_02930, partial [Acidimicrobiales bacterium]|nr:hypothetical protein [Acidimicrobiales bacterium]